MKLKQKLEHKLEQKQKPPKEWDKNPKAWIRSMRALTKFIRLRRYIVNDFYFNEEKDK